MVLTSCASTLNLTVLTQFLLLLERVSLSFCGCCMAYFFDYYLSNIHSSIECLGPLTKHVFHCSADCLDSLHDFFALARMALLRVGWQGGLSSFKFPAMNGTVRFFPGGGLRRCLSFVYLLQNLFALKHVAYILCRTPLKVPAL